MCFGRIILLNHYHAKWTSYNGYPHSLELREVDVFLWTYTWNLAELGHKFG